MWASAMDQVLAVRRCKLRRIFSSCLPSLTLALVLGHGAAAPAEDTGRTAPARVLLIRGIFNVFSIGIDDLGQALREKGHEVEVTPPEGSWASALRLRDAYLRDPQGGPIVLIGHSMGGRACLHISRYLQSYNIPVALVVILDSNPWTTVPENVERCLNLYVTNPYGVFHGSPVQGNPSANIINVDVTKVRKPQGADDVNHFNIEKSPWMQSVVIREVARAQQACNARAAHARNSPTARPQRLPSTTGPSSGVRSADSPATPGFRGSGEPKERPDAGNSGGGYRVQPFIQLRL